MVIWRYYILITVKIEWNELSGDKWSIWDNNGEVTGGWYEGWYMFLCMIIQSFLCRCINIDDAKEWKIFLIKYQYRWDRGSVNVVVRCHLCKMIFMTINFISNIHVRWWGISIWRHLVRIIYLMINYYINYGWRYEGYIRLMVTRVLSF